MRLPAPPQGKARGSIRRVNRYRCGKCPYIYDPRKGDPEGGIPPGTPFSRIPASWRCPVCGAKKSDFYPLDEVAAPPPAAAPASRPVPSSPAVEVAPRAPLTSPLEQWTVGSL